MMFHCIKTIEWQGDVAGYAQNPVSEFYALDEDFIGRVASVSRSVSPRLTCLREAQRYLLLCRAAWVGDLDDLIRGVKRGRN